jgi:predicted enzyme related to lactoylglutathione lyase
MPGLMVNIDVDDLEKGIAFYRAAFGLTVGRRFGGGMVEMLGLPAPVYLLLKPAGTPASPGGAAKRDYARHWTPVHIDIVVEDISAALARAEKAGAVLEAPLTSANWGHMALMADPFGHGFCLIQHVGRGYNEIADPR